MQISAIGYNTIVGTDFKIDRLLGLLKQNLAREMTAFYLYNILTIYLDELELHGIREIVDAACARDRRHFKSLLKRIHQLSGTFPAGIEELDDNLIDHAAELSNIPLNVKEAFEKLFKVKRSSVLSYTRLCNLTSGRDRQTYLLALDILNEELELKTWFSQFMDAKYPGVTVNIP